MEPKSKEEYEQRFKSNSKITGYGMDTTVHVPCPFCAAPNFMSYKITEVEDVLGNGSVCGECNRGSRGIVLKIKGGTTIELVQTSGPDFNVSWLPPMRREEHEACL
jgi:hypothetical protein